MISTVRRFCEECAIFSPATCAQNVYSPGTKIVFHFLSLFIDLFVCLFVCLLSVPPHFTVFKIGHNSINTTNTT